MLSPAEAPGEDPCAGPSLYGNPVTLPAGDIRQHNPSEFFHGFRAGILIMPGQARGGQGMARQGTAGRGMNDGALVRPGQSTRFSGER